MPFESPLYPLWSFLGFSAALRWILYPSEADTTVSPQNLSGSDDEETETETIGNIHRSHDTRSRKQCTGTIESSEEEEEEKYHAKYVNRSIDVIHGGF